MTRIIRTKLPHFNSIIIIIVLQFENDQAVIETSRINIYIYTNKYFHE